MQKQQLNASSPSLSRSGWSSLEGDLLVLILQRLSLTDYIRFGAVCRDWNTIFSSKPCPPKPELPWYIIPDQPSTRPSLCFYCPEDGLVYHFPIPCDKDETGSTIITEHCPGFYSGWLMMAASGCPDSRPFLYNPLSGALVKIPPFPEGTSIYKTIVIPNLLHERDDPPLAVVCFEKLDDIEGVVRTWSPSCNDLKVGWSQIDLHEPSPSFSCWYEDIICYKGSLYIVANTGELRLVEFNTPHEDSAVDDAPQVRTVIGPFFDISLDPAVLVECKGELLLVSNPFPDARIEVFKANFSSRRWDVVDSLHGQVLLLTYRLPQCLKARHVTICEQICEENCIYFACYKNQLVKYRLGEEKFYIARIEQDRQRKASAASRTWLDPELPWTNIQDSTQLMIN